MRINEARFLAAAFVLHLTLPVAAYVAPSRGSLAFMEASPIVPQEVDVDVSDLPDLPTVDAEDAVPTQPGDAPSDEESGGDPSSTSVRRRTSATPAATADPDAPPSGDQPVLASDNPDSTGPGINGDYSLPPSASDVGGPGGAGRGPLWERPGMVPDEGRGRPSAPTRAPERKHDPHAGTKALREAMREKDSKLGLDLPAASAIAGVIRNAVRASETPYECTASLTVTLSGAGNVTAVSLNSFSGGSPGAWQNVRQIVLAQLKGINYPMKSAYEKGAIIGYGVTSLKKSPGGGTGRDGLTLKFDVTDIGARATRLVTVGWSARPSDG